MATKPNTFIDPKDLKKILQIVVGNWWILVLALIVSAVAAYFYSYKLPKIYAAKTQILLKQDDSRGMIQQGMLSDLYSSGYYGYEQMANQKKVLNSTDIVGEVVSRLKLDVSYYIVGRIQTKEVYSGTPFHVRAQIYNSSFYDFPFTFKIIDKDTYEISYEEKEKHFSQKNKFGESIVNNDYYLQIDKSPLIDNSTASSLKEITYQFQVHDQQGLIYRYKDALSVSDIEYTAILEVSMEDEIPERSVMFLDTLAKVYVNNSLKLKVKVNENTINYIDNQLKEVTGILDSIEDILEKYKAQKDILNLTKEEEFYYTNVTTYESQKRSYEMQLKSLDYLKTYILSNMNKELLPPSLYMDGEDAYLKTAIPELYALQVAINSSLFTATDKSTSVKEVEYKIELLRNDILKYIVNTDKAIRQKIQSIDEEIAFYVGMLKGVPANQRAILKINRTLQVNEKMYYYLLEKRAETVIARANIVSEVSVIESAHSVGIVKPQINKIYSKFISVGLVIAIVIALLRVVVFSKIETSDELRGLTGMPVLGEIFHSENAQDSYLVVDTQPRSVVTEAFRSLRTNLEYFAPGAKNKVVLITSNRPGVGKTFCSVNLSAILAKGGKKVLLLELDLHKPKIHTALNIKSELGITSILVGKVQPHEAILKTSVENLDVILSGPTPPNASELILSNHLSDLTEYAKKSYDYIIIDTPPMGMISDTLMLMKHSDINIFVLNTKHNPKEGLTYAHSVSETNKIKSFAFILNNVKVKHSSYYNKNYSYAYGYGSESIRENS